MNFKELAELESGTILEDGYENDVRYLIMRGPCALCAYVGVPEDHPLAGKDYDDLPMSVHGGLTFARAGKGETWPANWYWYGWDYGHLGDRALYDLDRGLDKGNTEWTPEMVLKQHIWDATWQFKKLMRLVEGI
jgi:hypothetical protein